MHLICRSSRLSGRLKNRYQQVEVQLDGTQSHSWTHAVDTLTPVNKLCKNTFRRWESETGCDSDSIAGSRHC